MVDSIKTVLLQEQVRDYVQQSLRLLFAHLLRDAKFIIPDADIGIVFKSAAQTHGKGEIQIQIYDAHLDDGNVLLWDVIESAGWSKAECSDLFTWLDMDAYKAHPELGGPMLVAMLDRDDWLNPTPIPPQRPIWRYHPQRQIEAPPWGKAIPRVARKSSLALSMDDLNDLTHDFSNGLNAFFSIRPSRIRAEANPDHGRAYSHYTQMLSQVVAYVRAGKQIYSFPKTLLELFRKTDVDDIAFEHVKLPYPAIYMHFGRQEDMPMGEGWFVEGVYLSELRNDHGDRYCNITLACCNEDNERFFAFDRGIEPSYCVALGPTHQLMALSEAIEVFVSDKIQRLKNEIAGHDKAQAELDEKVASGAIPRKVVSVTARNSQQELEQLLPRHDSFMKALRLAVNALVYVNAYPDDIETKWPENTSPSKLRELAKAKDKKSSQRVLSELAKAGFSPVHLCGRRLEEQLQIQRAAAGQSESRTVAMHWVRGHWRRQVHGPGNTLRKMIWRMPLLRGTRLAPEEEPLGHIYLVTP